LSTLRAQRPVKNGKYNKVVRKNVPFSWNCLCLSLIILLAACQDAETGSGGSTGGGGAEQPVPTLQPVLQQAATTAPSHKGSTLRATPLPLRATQPSHPASTFPAVETDAPLPPFSICSPLVETPLDDLHLIVADPYRPPPPGSELRHHGVDFAYFHRFDRAAIEGAGVQSVLKGQVAAAIVDSFPYGNTLIIETSGAALPAALASQIHIASGESLYVLYAHMERPSALRLGDNIDACQPLGNVGKSGNAGGAHLHIETRLGPSGTRFAGMGYYKAWASEEQRSNYLLWRTSGTYRHFDPMTVLSYRP
jgi:murein DD-endopeptidase MepM/ murein hydrolase activator NlpD